LVASAHSRGFTLVELLVVMALMGLLTALISPRVQSALPGFELRTAARELAAAFRETRAEAVRRGEPTVLTLEIDSGRYRVPGAETAARLPAGLKVDALVAARDVAADKSRARYRFYPDGTATGGQVTLARGDAAYRVDIDWMTGRVRILD